MYCAPEEYCACLDYVMRALVPDGRTAKTRGLREKECLNSSGERKEGTELRLEKKKVE